MHRHIGIYPGTFDPVHEGHISFAIEGAKIFHLEKVVFLPETTPREKQTASDISKRYEKLQKDLAPYPQLDLALVKSNQFTVVQTLPELHQLFPRCKFTFFMGSDVALHLPHWQDVSLLLADMSFLVAVREGESARQVEDVFQDLEKSTGLSIRYTVIESPKPLFRSSDIRKDEGAANTDDAR